MAAPLPLLPLVNGEPGAGAGVRIADVNPSTGAPFAVVACADSAEIEHAIEAATFATKLWRGAPFEERARRLARLAERVHEQAEALASLIALEQGKPFAEALALEVLPSLDHLQFLSRHAPPAIRRRSCPAMSVTYFEPSNCRSENGAFAYPRPSPLSKCCRLPM